MALPGVHCVRAHCLNLQPTCPSERSARAKAMSIVQPQPAEKQGSQFHSCMQMSSANVNQSRRDLPRASTKKAALPTTSQGLADVEQGNQLGPLDF